jgi:hypothetical protein
MLRVRRKADQPPPGRPHLGVPSWNAEVRGYCVYDEEGRPTTTRANQGGISSGCVGGSGMVDRSNTRKGQKGGIQRYCSELDKVVMKKFKKYIRKRKGIVHKMN